MKSNEIALNEARAKTPAASSVSGSAQHLIIQRKLSVGKEDDELEKEADMNANRVMRMPETGFVQRKCDECEKEEKLQRKAINQQVTPFLQAKADGSTTVSEGVSSSIQSSRGSGASLDGHTQSFMANKIGNDFSGVKIHTDSESAQLNRSLNAKAFTVGEDIYFNEGQYQPGSNDGKKLLAHELTHVMQQGQSIQGKTIQRYTTDDCKSDQRSSLGDAYPLSKTMVKNAIERLSADPVTTETKSLFANHFGAYAGWRRDIVVDIHYKPMLAILKDSEMNFECETECDGKKAYTYWVLGDVHLCPAFFSASVNEESETIIHELFHLRGSFDLGYHGNDEDADTWWIFAINNADSFSELAQDLYEQP